MSEEACHSIIQKHCDCASAIYCRAAAVAQSSHLVLPKKLLLVRGCTLVNLNPGRSLFGVYYSKGKCSLSRFLFVAS